MARTLNEEEYAVKRHQILDVTQKLIYTKGYEQMSIQEIIDELQISKGAFYHYFDSKQGLLEALIQHLVQEVDKILMPIVEDSQLQALEKLRRFFNSAARWKVARKQFMLALLTVWNSDDNAIVRQKIAAASLAWYTPRLTTIICQGIKEGVLTTPYPEQVGGIVFTLLLGLGDEISKCFLSNGMNPESFEYIKNMVTVYTDAIERVLGAPPGSIELIDEPSLKEWEAE
jgi:TetR/AcrR family transcriptional repressor of nem operon